MRQCSTYEAVLAEGRAEGLAHGQADSACQEARKLLLRQARKRLGTEAEAELATLEAINELFCLETLGLSLLTANSWQNWLDKVRIPPTAPRQEPAYMANFEFDPSPDSSGVDSFMEVKDLRGNRAVIHVRMQSQYEPDLGRTLWKESHKVRRQHNMPFSTVVILLHQGADGPDITGEYWPPPHRTARSGAMTTSREPFRYTVARAWEKRPNELLAGGLGTLPLAPMSNLTEDELPGVIGQMEQIINEHAKPEDAAKLWLSTYFFMGLRYPADLVQRLLANVMSMLRSTGNYQHVLAQGYVQGVSQGMVDGPVLAARRLLRAQADRRFGPPEHAVATALDSLHDLEHLETLAEHVLEAGNWRELLSTVGRPWTVVSCN